MASRCIGQRRVATLPGAPFRGGAPERSSRLCPHPSKGERKQTAHVEAGHRGRRREADRRAAHARRVHDRPQGGEHHPADRAQRVARARAPLQEERQRRPTAPPDATDVRPRGPHQLQRRLRQRPARHPRAGPRARRPRPDRRLPHRPAGRGRRRRPRRSPAAATRKPTLRRARHRARARGACSIGRTAS